MVSRYLRIISVANNIIPRQVRIMSCQLMILNRSIGQVHRQASAQGSCCATNVISTAMHTVIVRTSELVNHIGSVKFCFIVHVIFHY